MKRIQVGKYIIEQSHSSFDYHLSKVVTVSIKNNGKDTGETREEEKIQGYDMPLKAIVNVISEDESFKDSKTLTDLLKRIEFKLDVIAKIILDQLKDS